MIVSTKIITSENYAHVKHFGDLLKAILKENGIKQFQLAELTGLPRSRISEYVTGRRKPSFESFAKILYVLDLKLEPGLLKFMRDELGFIEPGKEYFDEPDDSIPAWLETLMPDLKVLDSDGQTAIKAMVEALKAKV